MDENSCSQFPCRTCFLSFFALLQLPSMHQELSDGRLDDELVVPSNTRVYSIAKVREKLHKVQLLFYFLGVCFVCLLFFSQKLVLFSSESCLTPTWVFCLRQQALHENYSVDQIHELTSIDRWFLHKLHRIVEIERDMKNQEL